MDWKVECPHCGKETFFERNNAWRKAQRRIKTGEKKFCRSCQSDYYLKHGSPSKGKELHGLRGASFDINMAKLQKWSRKVKKRDECCQYCGDTENLHAHHIFPKSRIPALRHEINNGITLCSDCHKEHHRLNSITQIKIIKGGV